MRNLSIRKHLYIAFVFFFLIPFVLTTFVSIFFVKKYMLERAYLSLGAVLDLKTNQIVNWMNQGQKAVKLVADMKSHGVTHSHGDNGLRLDHLLESGYKAHIRQIITSFPSVKSISVLEPDRGRVVYSTNQLFLERIRENEAYFKKGRAALYVSSIIYSVGREKPVLNISIPLKSEQQKLLAVIAAEMELSDLETSLNSRTGLGKTEKVFTIDSYGFYVTIPPDHQRFPLQLAAQNDTTRNLLQKKDGKARYLDTSGVDVISAFRWLPENNLGLFIEKNYDEIIEPIGFLQKILLSAALLFLCLGLVVIYFITKMIIDPVKQVADTADSLQQGDLAKRAILKGPLEVVALGESFNEMADTIQSTQSKLEDARNEAEIANKAKSEFLANMSHELRNPMHHILSYSKFGVVKSGSTSSKKRLHYFKQIRTSAERLMILLNDLLDLTKMEAGKMEYELEENDLGEIIRDAIDESASAAETKAIEIRFVGSDLSTKVRCDKFKIGQVLRNLIINAITYSDTGKSVTISTKKSNNGSRRGDREYVIVSVADQGVGIPRDELKKVFDKFYQSSNTKTGAGGTGLGLAICNEIVRAHNGTIWAANKPEGGSEFSFSLPAP